MPDDEDTRPGRGEKWKPVVTTDAGHAATIVSGRPSAPSVTDFDVVPVARAAITDVDIAIGPADTIAAAETGATAALRRPMAATRYRMGARLGLGGMGEVILAFDEHIGREVAVKRVLAAQPSAEERVRFWREARVQGRLEHPAVVPVHDLGVDADDRPYFVMKRLTGEPMADVLKRLRAPAADTDANIVVAPIDAREVASTRRRLLRAFVDVCLAIELAHSRGVVHRDLKPANIMLGDFGEVYVIDWGVARIVGDAAGAAPSASTSLTADLGDSETRAGAVMGTPAYMAPEQLAGEPALPAADVYALGCVLFEIVAGEPLHLRTRSVVKAADGRPSARRADAPPELDAVCQRATEQDPARRYASARALADAVQAFLDGDRDVAVRRELAGMHLARALELVGGPAATVSIGDGTRSAAMAEAGRALALDPESAEAALLVTQLMLSPPKRTPPEVEARLAELDITAARLQGRLSALAMLGYLGFLPFVLWTGVRDWLHVAAFAGVVVAGGTNVYLLSRGKEIRGIYINACLNALVIGLVARLVGPFLIAPTLVTTTLVPYAVHPRLGRIWVIAGILACGVAVPWVLEIAGIADATYAFTAAGKLELSSPAIFFSSLPVQLAFALLLVVLIVTVTMLSRTLAMRQRDVTRRIELQAWQLRQLVPTKK